VEQLPRYAPDLNPVETLWGNIKGQGLANRCADKLADLGSGIQAGNRPRVRGHLAFYLEHAGLLFLITLSLYYP
jgi:transposase